MKHHILSILALIGGTAASAQVPAEADLTFDSTPHCTWPVVGTTTSDYSKYSTYIYRPQAVKGWTLNPASNTNGCAAAVSFTGWCNASLGATGFAAPATAPVEYYDDDEANAHVLGLLASGGKTVQYTAPLALERGTYTITFPIYNAGGTNEMKRNLMGFVAESYESFSPVTAYAVGEWVIDTVRVDIEEPTVGAFSVGYTAPTGTIAKMPHLWVERVEIRQWTSQDSLEAGVVDAIQPMHMHSTERSTIYDLSGRRVDGTLQRGIYITNRHKTLKP